MMNVRKFSFKNIWFQIRSHRSGPWVIFKILNFSTGWSDWTWLGLWSGGDLKGPLLS